MWMFILEKWRQTGFLFDEDDVRLQDRSPISERIYNARIILNPFFVNNILFQKFSTKENSVHDTTKPF